MNALEFLQVALENSAFLVILSIILTLSLYRMTARVAGGMSDPFHFYYAFTFGTSYAVVALMALKGYIGPREIGIVIGYGLVFLVGFRLFSRLSLPVIYRAICILWGGGRTFLWLAVLVYFVAALVYLRFVGFAFFDVSRFDANRGFGLLVRIMDPLRLFIIGYLAIKVAMQRGKRAFGTITVIICFALVSSLINGAKFALLESAYAAGVAIAINSGRKGLPLKHIRFPALLVLLLATGYALTQLFFSLKADSSQAVGGGASVSGGSLLFAQFAVRILSNGDMYYLGLSPAVLGSIHVDHPFEQLFGPILGGGATSLLFGYDISNTDVGRQIILYWDPYYSLSGGPTNHFDLTAYVYFGPALGILFVICLAMILAQINSLKLYRYNIVGCSAVSALYCRSLAILLNPATGLALISDSIVVFSLIALAAKILNALTVPYPTESTMYPGS